MSYHHKWFERPFTSRIVKQKGLGADWFHSEHTVEPTKEKMQNRLRIEESEN